MVGILQANQTIKWKIVFFHRPFFTIGPHAGEMNTELSTWWAAFDAYGVDLVLNGHDHMYERSKPINYSVSPTAPVAQYGSGPGQGRCEIVCGGAGATLYKGTPTWFIQTYQSAYNFCKINVDDCVLTDSTFNNTGGLIETFSLNKCATGIGNKNQVFNTVSCVPNPTKSNFTLHYNSALTGEATITVIDMNGNKIAQFKTQKTHENLEYKIDLSNQARGVYVIQVDMSNQKDRTILELN